MVIRSVVDKEIAKQILKYFILFILFFVSVKMCATHHAIKSELKAPAKISIYSSDELIGQYEEIVVLVKIEEHEEMITINLTEYH